MTSNRPAAHVARRPAKRPADNATTGLEQLRCHVDRDVLAALGEDRDVMVSQVVTAAIDAFLRTGGDPRQAAVSVAPLLRHLSERKALRGFTNDDLVAAFAAARVTAQKRLAPATDGTLSRDLLMRMREDLMTYLSLLFAVAAKALETTSGLLTMTAAERSRHIAAAIFEQTATPRLDHMAQISGIHADKLFIAVVATSGPLPDTLLEQAGVVAQTPSEILLPESHDLANALRAEDPPQVVTGPPTVLTESAEALKLARRVAALLRADIVRDPRRIVPCMDLLGALVLDSHPFLAGLAVRKHLAELEAATAQRRLSLGEMCLHWLERGLPMNQLARELGIPPQTAHSRMKTLRTMFGDALDDPLQRMELIVALRASLPRWRAEA